MLEEAVGHFFEREANILEADLLADDVRRNRGKALMHRAHDARQHGAVANACVEDPEAWRMRMDVRELERYAIRDHPFLAAGIDEEQIFLPVVVEAEILVGGLCGRLGGHGAQGWGRR